MLMCTLNITVVSLRTNLSSSAAAPAAAITVVDNREAKKPGEMGEEEEQRGTFVPAGLIAVEEHEPQVLAPAVMEKDEETCPKDYYFKGFLSWCLWGYVPIEESGEDMKSNLFSDSKTNTSFGRNTGSRSALKKAACALEDGMLPIFDERRGAKKQRLGDSRRASSTSTLSSGGETRDNVATWPGTIQDGRSTAILDSTSITASVLSQTLAFMDLEAIEKQLQKKNSLQARILRDELASTIRMSDKLWQRYEHMKDPGMLAKLHQCDANVVELELLLKVLQSDEVVRRTEAIATRAASLITIPLQCPTTSTSPSPAKTMVLPSKSVPDSVQTPATKPQPTQLITYRSPMPSLCIDCSVISTTHTCRRCKQYVCDICCSNDRELEMVWWCRNCFDNESLTTQTIIRAGNYNSDGDDDSNDDDNRSNKVNK